MKTTWILVANNTHARIFSAQTPSSALQEIEVLTHDRSRLHDRDLTSDLPGKIKNTGGIGGHAFEQPTDPKQHEADVFAHEVATHLGESLNTGAFEQLLIIADPSFLGFFRKTMSDNLKKCVRYELDKNIVTLTAEEIRNHLPDYLPSL
jgi:protein required for attachment to host cells